LLRILFIIFSSLLLLKAASSHQGVIDTSGCHRDNKMNDYHCHSDNRINPQSTYHSPYFSGTQKQTTVFYSSGKNKHYCKDSKGNTMISSSPCGLIVGTYVPYLNNDWPYWVNAKGDCQNTRAKILIRDNIGQLTFKDNRNCFVARGHWVDPYSGKHFTKASKVDVDHIVPLAHAHLSGGFNWTWKKKRDFANDPLNLLVINEKTKRANAKNGPEYWKPANRDYWCEYSRKWSEVKAKYGLKISSKEKRVLKDMSATCH